jgi:hypothetical protein
MTMAARGAAVAACLGLGLGLVAACGGKAAPATGGGAGTGAVGNEAGPPAWAPALRVRADRVPGWLGLATRPPGGEFATPWWTPYDAESAAVVPLPAEGLAEGQEVLVVPTSGTARNRNAGAAREILYGCDGGFGLDVVPLGGDRLPTGPVWVVPMPLDDGWAPAAVVLEEQRAEPASRTWRAGALTLTSTKLDASHTSLEFTADGRVLGALPGEMYFMDGADPEPVDLTQEQPGIPYPVAAWELAADGPVLVTVHLPSFEGVHLSTYLVDATSVTEVPTMQHSLYYCAF